MNDVADLGRKGQQDVKDSVSEIPGCSGMRTCGLLTAILLPFAFRFVICPGGLPPIRQHK